MTGGTIEISDVRRLRAEPGELLLVTLPAHFSNDQTVHVVRLLREALPPGVRALIVSEEVEIKFVAGAAETPEEFAAQVFAERA